jgi:hypothetical protein
VQEGEGETGEEGAARERERERERKKRRPSRNSKVPQALYNTQNQLIM